MLIVTRPDTIPRDSGSSQEVRVISDRGRRHTIRALGIISWFVLFVYVTDLLNQVGVDYFLMWLLVFGAFYGGGLSCSKCDRRSRTEGIHYREHEPSSIPEE